MTEVHSTPLTQWTAVGRTTLPLGRLYSMLLPFGSMQLNLKGKMLKTDFIYSLVCIYLKYCPIYKWLLLLLLTCSFYLFVLGICMEALCSPRMVEPPESVMICLRALFTLLDSEMPRQMLMFDRSLSIELCNVLHRSILDTYCYCIRHGKKEQHVYIITFCILLPDYFWLEKILKSNNWQWMY